MEETDERTESFKFMARLCSDLYDKNKENEELKKKVASLEKEVLFWKNVNKVSRLMDEVEEKFFS
jgi:hypothetical protein